MRIAPFFITLCCFVALCAAPSAQAQSTFALHVFDFGFGTAQKTPVTPIIHAGDTIDWVWDVPSTFGTQHSATSVAGIAESWNSGLHSTGSGDSFSHLFTHAGDFQYFCEIHGFDNGNQTARGMHGQINVQPVPEASTVVSSGILLTLGLGCLALASRRRKASLHNKLSSFMSL